MPFNGSGVYQPPGTVFPAIAGTLIEAEKFNTIINDIAGALSLCLPRDGQSAFLGNISAGGYMLTNLGVPTAVGHALVYGRPGDGTQLSLNASNLASGTVPNARVSGSYTNITGIGNTGTHVTFSTSGNVTINAPSSGNALSLNYTGADGEVGLFVPAPGPTTTNMFPAMFRGHTSAYTLAYLQNVNTNGRTSFHVSGFNGASDVFLTSGPTVDRAGVGTGTSTQFDVYTGGIARGTISAAGNWTINAPSSGSHTFNGDITFSGDITFNGDITFGGTLTGNGSGLTNLNASNLASGTVPSARISGAYTGITQVAAQLNQSELSVSGGAGTFRLFGTQTGSNRRWALGANSDTESGSNTGSNFSLYRYADDGSFIGAVLSVSRQSGFTTFNAGARTTPVSVGFSSTPTFNALDSNVFYFGTLTGNVTSMTISNPADGQTLQIRFVQDGTGGRTVALPSGALVSGSINTAPNSVTWLVITYVSTAARWEGTWTKVN